MSTIAARRLDCRVRNEIGYDPPAEPPEPNTRNSHFVLKDLKGEVSVYEIRKSKVCKQIEVLYRVPHERLDILVLLGYTPYGAST